MVYKVICHATEEIEIEADNMEDAEALAIEQCQFQWVDYCDTEETR